MKLVEKYNENRKRHKTNRELFYVYQRLLVQAEEQGVISLDFGETTSLLRKIDILRNIVRQTRPNKKGR